MKTKSFLFFILTFLAFAAVRKAYAAPLPEAVVEDFEDTFENIDGPQWGLFASDPFLREGEGYARWIDRLELPEYAAVLYETFEESADGDGIDDFLISDGYFDKNGPNATAPNSSGTVSNILNIFSERYTVSDYGSAEDAYAAALDAYNEIRTSGVPGRAARAAYDAFDRDHPEVFWLSGKMRTRRAVTPYLSDPDPAYVLTFDIVLRAERSDGSTDIDMRIDGYMSESVIRGDIEKRNELVSAINGLSDPSSPVRTATFFNEWLTHHNGYNTLGSSSAYPPGSRECLLALEGNFGELGPVCEGYARAFKVLCDTAGIPCVLVSGPASVYPALAASEHMWNYVNLFDRWYAVDVTWNDGGSGSSALSGAESTDWLFVGADSVLFGSAFTESHTLTNIASDGGISFLNGPVLSASSLSDDERSGYRLDITLADPSIACGKRLGPDDITVTCKNDLGFSTVLKPGGYSLSYSTRTPGPKTLIVTAPGFMDQSGDILSAECELTVYLELNDDSASVQLPSRIFYYEGEPVCPEPSVTARSISGETYPLTAGTDYELSWDENTTAGTARVIVTGIGYNRGTVEKEFNIRYRYSTYIAADQTPVDHCAISAIPPKTYTGSPIRPVPKVTLYGAALVEGRDYRLYYVNNINASSEGSPAIVRVIGIGSYSGVAERTFAITQKNIKKVSVISGISADSSDTPVLLYDGGRMLREGADYICEEDKRSGGTVTFTVKAAEGSNYIGKRSVSVAVAAKGSALTASDIAVEGLSAAEELYSCEYTGKAQKPALTVKKNGITLSRGRDYTVRYKMNKNAGTAYITVTGKGTFSGKVLVPFMITPSTAPLKVDITQPMTYTGRILKPRVKVYSGQKRLPSSSYHVEYNGTLNAGTGYVTVTGLGNYAGLSVYNAKFTILQRSIKSASLKHSSSKVTLRYRGRLLRESYDYTVSNGIITGIGNFTGKR